ncbi:MAG: trigger factor [Alphaproteobacteria bacterium]|nr:trigger factor [Alphaproteobacteria bacterium]
MQIKETAKKGLKREYTVVVPAKDIEAQTQAKLLEVGKTAKIAGFRPGHVPVSMLKQRYGKSVMGEVLESAVHNAQHKVIDEKKLRPALQPEIKIKSFDDGKDLEFDMVVELFPEVPEIDLKNIEIVKPTYDITDKEINEAIERIASRNQSRTPKADSAKAVKGDAVRIDFKGMKDGVAFEGGTAENFNLELGSGQFIPGFEEQLIGAKKGDKKNVEVTFPEEYHAPDLAGQPVVFEVKVHEVLEASSPKINDEFAKGIGFEDVKSLKEMITEHLSKDYDQYVRNKMKKDLFDQLEDICTFEVPEGMVESEFKQIWAKLKQAQEQGDPSVSGRDDKDLEKEYRAIAERRVRLGVYLAELGRAQKVQVSQQELMNAVVEQARQFPGQEQQVVEFYQKNPNHIEELRGPIFEDKVVDNVFGKIKTKEKKFSLEELVQMDMDEEAPKKATKKSTAKKPAADEKATDAKKVAEKKPAEKKSADAKSATKAPAAKKTAAKK